MSAPTYQSLAARLADEIRGGHRQPGEQLPPIRRLAFELGVAPSTLARAYAQLVEQGMVAGEVGRGTFVRALPHRPALAEPGRAGIVDLEFNATPVTDAGRAALVDAMGRAASAGADGAAGSSSAYGTASLRDALAGQLPRDGWLPEGEQILVAGGGRQAIAGAMAALTKPGQPIGLEELTYPMAKAIARDLGRPAVPLAMDSEGVRPDALERARVEQGVRVVYAQPTLHNPTGATMSAARRLEMAQCLRRHDMVLIEDAVYAFLKPAAPPPIAALAPERVVLIDSLSKRGFSGLPLGVLVAGTEELRRRLAQSLRSGAWLAAPLIASTYADLVQSGALRELEASRREDAATRQGLVREVLAGWRVDADPASFHVWMHLAPGWRSERFAAEALRAGVAVTASPAFAVQASYAPPTVRLALSKPPLAQLRQALGQLAALDRAEAFQEPS